MEIMKGPVHVTTNLKVVICFILLHYKPKTFEHFILLHYKPKTFEQTIDSTLQTCQ